MVKDKHLYKKIFNEMSKVKYSGSKCLWDNCISEAIKSHSHTEKILRNICSSNHVYGINKNILAINKGDFFRKYGVQEASTFNGFCSIHDNNLFKDIENHDLTTIGNREAFLFLTRSVFFDYYQKQCAILRLKKLIKLLKKYNLSSDEEVASVGINGNQFYIDNDFPDYEKKIFQYFKDSNYSDIIYKYRIIKKSIPISLATNINPLFNNHLPTLGVAQPFFALHILPYKSYGIIIVSWFKEYDHRMQWISDKFDTDFNTLINYLCFIESEDYLLSPKFYDNRVKGNRDFFSKAFFNRVNFPDFGFDDTKIFFDFS